MANIPMATPNNYKRRVPRDVVTYVNSATAEVVAPQSAVLEYRDGVLIRVTKNGVAKSLTYQDGRLVQVSSPTASVALSYDSAGNLATTTVTNA